MPAKLLPIRSTGWRALCRCLQPRLVASHYRRSLLILCGLGLILVSCAKDREFSVIFANPYDIPRYRSGQFLVGTGMSDESLQAAQELAKSDIVAQISQKLTSLAEYRRSVDKVNGQEQLSSAYQQKIETSSAFAHAHLIRFDPEFCQSDGRSYRALAYLDKMSARRTLSDDFATNQSTFLSQADQLQRLLAHDKILSLWQNFPQLSVAYQRLADLDQQYQVLQANRSGQWQGLPSSIPDFAEVSRRYWELHGARLATRQRLKIQIVPAGAVGQELAKIYQDFFNSAALTSTIDLNASCPAQGSSFVFRLQLTANVSCNSHSLGFECRLEQRSRLLACDSGQVVKTSQLAGADLVEFSTRSNDDATEKLLQRLTSSESSQALAKDLATEWADWL